MQALRYLDGLLWIRKGAKGKVPLELVEKYVKNEKVFIFGVVTLTEVVELGRAHRGNREKQV
jgi:hypothetical protein